MQRITPQPGQESVWDYPRPPRLERCKKQIRIVFADKVIAETTQSVRVLETSHAPVYYISPDDISPGILVPTDRKSLCEWKGVARYFHVMVGDFWTEKAAWSYAQPTGPFEAIRDYVAFYAQLMDACYVDGQRVQPQAGGFYGGWITSDIVGPFKGEAGTAGW